MMVLAAESDMEIFGSLSRSDGRLPNYIQYELPGVSHLPTPVIEVSSFGATRQNPADVRPFVRGAFRTLQRWVARNIAPPPAIPMQRRVDAAGNFIPDRDADGNALGGIRLPHMPSIRPPRGLPAGAPLVTYRGIDPGGFPANVFVILEGTFEPFSEEELKARYSSKYAIRTLVKRADDDLFDNQYILRADRHAYTKR